MALVTANQFQLQPNTAQAISSGLQLGGQIKQQFITNPQIEELTQQAAKGDPQALTQLSAIAPQKAQEIQRFQATQQENRFNSVVDAAFELQSIPTMEGRIARARQRKEQLINERLPTQDTDQFLALAESGDFEGANALVDSAVNAGIQRGRLKAPRGMQKPAGQVEFESKLKGLTDEQKKEAVLVNLGLSPRAVGSAIQTITGLGIEEQIGDAEATIKERSKFGELSGAARSKAIDKGVEKIQKINVGIQNIDKALSLLEGGAGVGAIERWVPSIKGATVALNNLQSTMALDVIGAVTFGALSQGELDLAKNVALNTKLDTPDLIADLQARKAAQEKLRSYFDEQVQFLDQGGSVAGFLRHKQRMLDEQQQAPQQAAQQQVIPQQQAPAAAIQMLQQNPQFADQFQAKFGFLPEGF